MTNQPIPVARNTRWIVAGNRVLFVVAVFAIWLATLTPLYPPNDSLDSSWQLVLGHAWEHRFVFGRDIVYTYGPWGWLTAVYFHPAIFEPRMIWEIAFKALAAGFTTMVAFQLPWWRRWLLVAAALLLLPLFYDTIIMLVLAGLVVWCGRQERAPPWLAASGVLLGFVALQKFTYLLIVASGAGALTLQWALRRDFRRAAVFDGSIAVSVVVAWLAASQPLSALPEFLQHTGSITAGYPYAMYWDETIAVFRFGAGSGILYLVLVWWRVQWAEVPLALALTAFGLLSWKHGFTRADGHTLGFFLCMIAAAIAAPCLRSTRSHVRSVASWLLLVIAVIGASAAVPAIMGNVHRFLPYHWQEHARMLLQWSERHQKLEAAFAAQQATHHLPAIDAAVGPATIDQFGYEQAVLLFNSLNYRPRPVFQSFHAYSDPLFRLNEASYLGSAAPAFTLTRLQTIDGRYPALDDALLLRRLITDHDVATSERGFLLLRRHARAADITTVPFAQGRLRYGIESCEFRGREGQAIWARIDAPLSWIGWLRAVFYKPPEVRLLVTDATGNERSYRLVVPAARGGFLLSPVLLDTAALEQMITRRRGTSVARIRVEVDPAQAVCFLKRARYEFAAVPVLDFIDPTREPEPAR